MAFEFAPYDMWPPASAYDSLTPRDANSLRMRFGIEVNTDHTREDVG